MAKIFVSYNRSSEPVVKSLAADIQSLGHTAWFDQDLSGGQAWWDQILSMIQDCSVFVFVLSPEALESTACKREYTYAAALKKPVLPVLIGEGVSTKLLPPALSKIEYVDYRKQDRDAAFRLARALSTIPNAEALPDPLPQPPAAPISYLGSLTEQIDSPSTLSYPDQAALVADLRRSLRESENVKDAQVLLKKLRRRADILASLRDDIDDLLRQLENTNTPGNNIVADREIHFYDGERTTVSIDRSAPGAAAVSPYPTVGKERVFGAVPLLTSDDTHSKTQPIGYAEKLEGRMKGAVEGLIAGPLALVLLAMRHGYLAPVDGAKSLGFAVAGALAGLIGATRGERVVSITLGMILALIPQFFPGELKNFSFAFLPISALVVRLISRRRA